MTNKSRTAKTTEVLTLAQFIEQHVIADKTKAIQDLKLDQLKDPAYPKTSSRLIARRNRLIDSNGKMLVQLDWSYVKDTDLNAKPYQTRITHDSRLWGIRHTVYAHWTIEPTFETEYQAMEAFLKARHFDPGTAYQAYFRGIDEFYEVSEYLAQILIKHGYAAIAYSGYYLWGRPSYDCVDCDLILSDVLNQLYAYYRDETQEAITDKAKNKAT